MTDHSSPPPPFDAAAWEARKAFLTLDADDESRLRALADSMGPEADAFASAFYEHLLRHPPTRELLLAAPDRLERLKQIQARYFRRLLQGNYNEDYARERLRVGQTHDRVGLSVELYLGAFCQYLQQTIPAVCDQHGVDSPQGVATLQSLSKVVFLDMGLAIDAYVGARTAELQRSKDFLERVLTSISDGVFVTDADGTVVEVNPKLCAMTGRTRAQLVGTPAYALWGETDAAAMLHRIDVAMRQGDYHDDRTLCCEGDRRIPVAFSLGSIRSPEASVRGFVGVVRDMTERNALVDALNQANANLEDRVAERSRALQETQAQLLQAEKLSAIGQLAAGIAHEIGTPLNVISGRAEFLLEELDAHDSRSQGLRVIVAQIDRITGLIHKLLDFARDRGDVMTNVRVSRVLAGILPLVETLMRKRNIKVVCVGLDALPEVFGNSNQLQQIFLNLLVNAADAIRDAKPARDGSIEVSGVSTPEHVVVRVRDNGCGIASSDLARIFNPFFTTKPTGQGTGLGLSVTYGLLRDMGGSIHAESEAGQGAMFEIHLRRASIRPR